MIKRLVHRQRILKNQDKNQSTLGLYCVDPSLGQLARVVEKKTGVARVTEKTSCNTLLFLSGNGLALCQANKQKQTCCVQVDFTSTLWSRRIRQVRQERLIQAMGRKPLLLSRIVDATGGLGRDSFLLAAAGFQVRIFERNPIIEALLADGLQRAEEREDLQAICARIRLHRQDALDFLQQPDAQAEIVYLDPMFPKTKTSAKVKKELQLLQQLAGDDQDLDLLFTAAMETATKRVVVKRPRTGPWLNRIKPSYSLQGTRIRFDIYLVTASTD